MNITLGYGPFNLELTTPLDSRDDVQRVTITGDEPAVRTFKDLAKRGRLGGIHGHMIDLDSVTNTDLLAACKILVNQSTNWTLRFTSIRSFPPVKIPKGVQT